MKALIPGLFLLFIFHTGYAQDKKIEIVCEVTNGEINYGKLSKYLPDSLKHSLFTSKKLHKYEALDIVTLLNMQGWKLISATPVVRSTAFSGATSNTAYIMKNEISVSQLEYELIQAKLDKDFK
jgi:hypothetical protein